MKKWRGTFPRPPAACRRKRGPKVVPFLPVILPARAVGCLLPWEQGPIHCWFAHRILHNRNNSFCMQRNESNNENNNRSFWFLSCVLLQRKVVYYPKCMLHFTCSHARLNSSHFNCKLWALPVSSLLFFYCMYPFSKCSPHNCCIWNPAAAETTENMSLISP